MTLVAGPSGAGKTTWIRQQVPENARSALYLSLGLKDASIDATYLAAEVPEITVLQIAQFNDFLQRPNAEGNVYLELGCHIDLKSLTLPDRMASCYRVVLLPPGTRDTEWHDWADLVVTGVETSIWSPQLHLWHSALTGQVLDSASLNTFWYELTNGAYGRVRRAKGIFDVADGRAFYFDFVAGLPERTGSELSLPRWLNGRPDRFSGIEIVGEALAEETIAQTIKDCCLDERAIAYYQQQIRDLAGEGAIV
jgi:hypothetical protein